jgi:hypothetical protein
MKWIARLPSEPTHRFVIEADTAVGFYLYIFDAEKCTHDYLQDTFDAAVRQAEDDYGVPPSEWHQISDSPTAKI